MQCLRLFLTFWPGVPKLWYRTVLYIVELSWGVVIFSSLLINPLEDDLDDPSLCTRVAYKKAVTGIDTMQ